MNHSHTTQLSSRQISTDLYPFATETLTSAKPWLLQDAQAARALAHELCMHLRCAGPYTVDILSVGMDRIPRGPVLSANVICFSMELASMSLKTYIA